MKSEKLVIEGMSCNHCVSALKAELTNQGVLINNISVGNAEISYDEQTVPTDAIVEAVSEAGFVLKQRTELN